MTDELVEEVAKRVGVTPLQVNEVLTYYSMLHRKPMGNITFRSARTFPAYLSAVKSSGRKPRHKLGIGHKQVSADGLVSLEEVECIGACSWAPAIQVNYDFYHDVTMAQLEKID